MDDWQRFVNESDPYGVAGAGQAAPGPIGVQDIEDVLHLSMGYLGVTLDWLDEAEVAAQMLLGGKGVWFDYLQALRIGMTGAQIENTLNDQGIVVRAKSIIPKGDSLVAVVVVDADKEQQTRKLFTEWGILL